MVGDAQLMCAGHWQEVSAPLREEVYAAWRARKRGEDGALRRHQVACERAIASVEGREPNVGSAG